MKPVFKSLKHFIRTRNAYYKYMPIGTLSNVEYVDLSNVFWYIFRESIRSYK